MKQQGVTLLQIMSALAVAGLLTQLGVSAYGKLSAELDQAATVRELAQALRDARNQALLRQRAIVVQPLENDWGKGWRVLLEHNSLLLREHRLAKPARIVASSGRAVRFSGRGAALGDGFGGITLTLCRRGGVGNEQRVVLSPSGRVRLLSDGKRRCAGD